MADKPYDASRGVLLDADFTQHCKTCERCAQFDAAKPATAALMCLEGSVLYKRDSVVRERKPQADRGDHYATKAEVKAAMRYRGE